MQSKKNNTFISLQHLMQTIDFQARQLSKSPYYAHFISLSTYQDKRLQRGNTAKSDMEKVNMT